MQEQQPRRDDEKAHLDHGRGTRTLMDRAFNLA
jgi:hypothetical protein